jgi:hypothetical protein
MRRSLLLLSYLLAAGPAHADDPAGSVPINAVLGDASWVALHGVPPDASVAETDRLRTHLLYVERLLRAADTTELSASQRARRARLLLELEAYARAGVFPQRRSDDGHGPRRPLFIDDRGVHCAVGELIRASGAPELARAIHERWEHAYVTEIDSPALRAWAAAHGLRLGELAMIQPTYGEGSATPGYIRRSLDRAKEDLTLACARDHEPPDVVLLEIRRDERGRVHIVAAQEDGFAQCFAQKAGVGARDEPARDEPTREFRFSVQLAIELPQLILEQRLGRLNLHRDSTRCIPRPGPVPRVAHIHVLSNAEGLSVAVRTEPANDEVIACLTEYLQQVLRRFGAGRWQLEAQRTVRLRTAMSTPGLRRAVVNYAPGAATYCYDEDAPSTLRVRARAVLDAADVELEIDGGSAAFRACLTRRIQARIRSDLLVPRQMPDGSVERFFRIDARAEATVDVRVRSPAEREQRRRKQRRNRVLKLRYDP